VAAAGRWHCRSATKSLTAAAAGPCVPQSRGARMISITTFSRHPAQISKIAEVLRLEGSPAGNECGERAH
jgi:hypothetical protein